LAAGLGAMEVGSSTETGAPSASYWEREIADPKLTEADHDQSRLTFLSLPIQFHLPDLSRNRTSAAIATSVSSVWRRTERSCELSS
jgi:hypothetical protein